MCVRVKSGTCQGGTDMGAQMCVNVRGHLSWGQISFSELLSTQKTPVERVQEEISDLRAEVRYLRNEVNRLMALVQNAPLATALSPLSAPACPLSAPASPVTPANTYSTPATPLADSPTIDLSQEVAAASNAGSLTVHERLRRHTQVVRDGILARKISMDFAEI